MNSLRNKVQLIGNLGQDPEVRTFENGRAMAQWHNLVAWGNLAKTIQKFLIKGMEVAVEGKLTHRIFDDKEGKKRYFTEVVMTDLVMLRNKTPEAD
jgi:single-strand DNA-binding protein